MNKIEWLIVISMIITGVIWLDGYAMNGSLYTSIR